MPQTLHVMQRSYEDVSRPCDVRRDSQRVSHIPSDIRGKSIGVSLMSSCCLTTEDVSLSLSDYRDVSQISSDVRWNSEDVNSIATRSIALVVDIVRFKRCAANVARHGAKL